MPSVDHTNANPPYVYYTDWAEAQGPDGSRLLDEAMQAWSRWEDIAKVTNGVPALRFKGELGPKSDSRPIWQVFEEVIAELPKTLIAHLPEDGAAQHDHYIYGTPKQAE